MRQLLHMLTLLALVTVSSAVRSADAEPVPAGAIDEQLQNLKQDVLQLSEKLAHIEQQLLYPADTHINLFISLPHKIDVVLESARINIDGERVSTHIYSEAENLALQKGGVQRIYTGNVTPGEHSIEVVVNARKPDGDKLQWTRQHTFSKADKAAFVEAQLLIDDAGVPGIQFNDE